MIITPHGMERRGVGLTVGSPQAARPHFSLTKYFRSYSGGSQLSGERRNTVSVINRGLKSSGV